MLIEEIALGRARLALNERKIEIAAENGAAGAGEAVVETCRHRADAGNRHHAERDTGDEYAEAAQTAAQFAPGKAQRGAQPHITDRLGRGRQHHAASASFGSCAPDFCALGATRARTKCVGT